MTWDGIERRKEWGEALRQIGQIQSTVENLHEDILALTAQVDRINAMTNRWKGAAAVILSMGALVGWIIERTEVFKKLF